MVAVVGGSLFLSLLPLAFGLCLNFAHAHLLHHMFISHTHAYMPHTSHTHTYMYTHIYLPCMHMHIHTILTHTCASTSTRTPHTSTHTTHSLHSWSKGLLLGPQPSPSVTRTSLESQALRRRSGAHDKIHKCKEVVCVCVCVCVCMCVCVCVCVCVEGDQTKSTFHAHIPCPK